MVIDGSFNRNGGLTLVPMPGFEDLALSLKEGIEAKGKKDNEVDTPVDIVIPSFGFHANREPDIKLGKDHVGGHDCVVLTSGPGTYEMTGQLIYAVGYLAGRKPSRISIASGYFPLGRTDKDEGTDIFALPPIFYRALEGVSQGLLSRIVCADPHCDQIVMAGPTGRVTPVYLTRRLLVHMLGEARCHSDRVCLAFPDDTASKRFKPAIAMVEQELGIELRTVVAAQRRTSSRNKNVAYVIGDTDALAGSIVIALDDETATGTSQINAAVRFKQEYGAKQVWAAVTHGVLCEDGPERFADPACAIDRLYITDTIPFANRPELQALFASGRLHTISWVDDLVWIIYHLHWDRQIRGVR